MQPVTWPASLPKSENRVSLYPFVLLRFAILLLQCSEVFEAQRAQSLHRYCPIRSVDLILFSNVEFEKNRQERNIKTSHERKARDNF